MERLEKQKCPFCGKSELALTEDEKDIPYFGKVYLFSMNCSECKYAKSDVESVSAKEGTKWVIEVDSAIPLQLILPIPRIKRLNNATVFIRAVR